MDTAGRQGALQVFEKNADEEKRRREGGKKGEEEWRREEEGGGRRETENYIPKISDCRRECTKSTTYSEESRGSRKYYKNLVARWKKRGTHEDLTERLKAKSDFNETIKAERRRNNAKSVFELNLAKDEHA